ncbi:uncharacterized protein [Amphiura filiformis]|uniref:uncharacterized protein n=1 Tax=Amphiura filiformis TaxID=82378 RepID=UPI003B225FB5
MMQRRADSAQVTPASASRCTPRQTNESRSDRTEATGLINFRRQHRSAWEAGHASHWRRIETRQSVNPEIIPASAAHTAHLGRVPDTPPPTASESNDPNTQEAASTSSAGGDRSMETEVAESSRPTLLMASPCPNIPPVASPSALPPSSYSPHSSPHSSPHARRTIPALLHHGHARRHIYHMGQDRSLRREREESGPSGGPETRRARVSRYTFGRTSLGRRTSQAALHRHYARHGSSIFDEENRPPSSSIHQYINRAIANAFAGRGETAVANNIGNTTYRLQWWNFQDFQLPDISRAEINVVVPHCKLHNDASCDIAQDGSLLAVFVPSPLGFPDDGELAIYSLQEHNFGDVMYTKSFGPNAITVSLSPLGGYVMVGLAARKLHWSASTKQLMAQIFRLARPGTDDSLVHIMDVNHPSESDQRIQISVNIAKWLPQPGRGFVYGTSRGHLRICTPRYMPCDEAEDGAQSDADTESSDDEITRRINLARRRRSYQELRSLALSSVSSAGSIPERRARGTQTARRIQFSIATQTDDVGTHHTSAQSSTGEGREGSGSNTPDTQSTSSGSSGSLNLPSTSSRSVGHPDIPTVSSSSAGHFDLPSTSSRSVGHPELPSTSSVEHSDMLSSSSNISSRNLDIPTSSTTVEPSDISVISIGQPSTSVTNTTVEHSDISVISIEQPDTSVTSRRDCGRSDIPSTSNSNTDHDRISDDDNLISVDRDTSTPIIGEDITITMPDESAMSE